MKNAWLAQTKFLPPLLREDFVPRQHLVDTLQKAVHTHSLTLISASPGYGKTTLLASLLAATPDFPIAWITLDEEDNDLVRCITALVARSNGVILLSELISPPCWQFSPNLPRIHVGCSRRWSTRFWRTSRKPGSF